MYKFCVKQFFTEYSNSPGANGTWNGIVFQVGADWLLASTSTQDIYAYSFLKPNNYAFI